MTEAELQILVADYLRLQYPDIMFHSDYGAGIKLTMGQATRQKRQNGGRRGWPDMFIAEPKSIYHGLFIELKKEGTRLWKKDGSAASEHIAEQLKVLGSLADRGYRAMFACGFNEAKEVIDKYLNNN